MKIAASGSKAFTMKLRPRAIGRLGITVYATTDQGPSDAVTKTLFVKVGVECGCGSWSVLFTICYLLPCSLVVRNLKSLRTFMWRVRIYICIMCFCVDLSHAAPFQTLVVTASTTACHHVSYQAQGLLLSLSQVSKMFLSTETCTCSSKGV